MTDSEVARLVESSEARAYSRLITEAPNEIRERYGLEVHTVASATALVAAGFGDSLILNRVIGLGVSEPATEDSVDQLDRVYRNRDVTTYACEIGPVSESPDLPARLRTRGFVPFKQMTMLYRPVESIPVPPCDLRIARVGSERAAEFADISCGIFQFAEPFPSLLRATFQDPAWQHWMAFDGERPAAVSITHIENEVAWIGWVGTLPDFRGRGAQTALTAAQFEGARESNCRWITLETATGSKNRPSQSLRNYRRLGFTVAYDRLVYVRRPVRV